VRLVAIAARTSRCFGARCAHRMPFVPSRSIINARSNWRRSRPWSIRISRLSTQWKGLARPFIYVTLIYGLLRSFVQHLSVMAGDIRPLRVWGDYTWRRAPGPEEAQARRERTLLRALAEESEEGRIAVCSPTRAERPR